MKHLLVLLFLVTVASSLQSQDVTTIDENREQTFTCDTVSFDTETGIYTFRGNVNFRTGEIDIVEAGEVILDSKERFVTAVDFVEVTVDGKMIYHGECQRSTLEYKLGSGELHLNKNCR